MKALLTTLITGLFVTTLSAQAEPQHIYGVRETVGTVENRGWERSIVQGNPNLTHWTWCPIYTNIQAVNGPPRSAPAVPSTQPVIPRAHYLKPTHLPLPIPERQRNHANYSARGDVAGSLHHDQVAGSLMDRKVAAALVPKAPIVASYGNYGAPSGYGTSSQVERTGVHGRLVEHADVHGKLASE